jgi:hypothetical protein
VALAVALLAVEHFLGEVAFDHLGLLARGGKVELALGEVGDLRP